MDNLAKKWRTKVKVFKEPGGASRRDHLSYALMHREIEGEILEFGIFKGWTGNHISSVVKPKLVHGFDSFNGLPEPWDQGNNRVEQDRFKMSEPPKMHPNYKMWIGLFAETIPWWKEEYTGPIEFLHIDSDLYSSCVTVLEELNSQIVPGTVIVFDDMFGFNQIYPKWREGEWKALIEWMEKYDREIEPLARRYQFSASCKVVK